MPLLLILLSAAGIAGLAVIGAMLVFERRFIYVLDRPLWLQPPEIGLTHEETFLSTDDAHEIHAWLLPMSGAPLTVLLCHGNAGTMSHRLERAALMQRHLGVSVLLFDYRGYGRSKGRPDERGTYRDARAAYRFLTETKGLPADRIVLFGESLGAAVATQIALEKPARALVLESPFASIPDMARAKFPALPPLGPLIRTRYDNVRKIAALKMPLLVLHGDQDTLIPIDQGRRVFAAAPEPKRLLVIEGAAHNDTYAVGGEAYWSAWRAFLHETAAR